MIESVVSFKNIPVKPFYRNILVWMRATPFE